MIVLNQMMETTRAAGSICIPRLYVTEDPGAVDSAAKQSSLSLRFGLGRAKAQSLHTGQTPVLKYSRQLKQAILQDRLPIADIANSGIISLEDAEQGHESFDQGVATKFVLDPYGELAKARRREEELTGSWSDTEVNTDQGRRLLSPPSVS